MSKSSVSQSLRLSSNPRRPPQNPTMISVEKAIAGAPRAGAQPAFDLPAQQAGEGTQLPVSRQRVAGDVTGEI